MGETVAGGCDGPEVGVSSRCWERGALTLTLKNGARHDVTARVSGSWAIHYREDGNADGWRLTHIPTGLLLAALPSGGAVPRLAALADALDALGDWSTDPLPRDLLDSAREAVARWREGAAA